MSGSRNADSFATEPCRWPGASQTLAILRVFQWFAIRNVHAPGLQLGTGGEWADIFCAYGSMICVHVLSVVLIHALSVALLRFVTPYFQIMTPAAHDNRTSGLSTGTRG